MKRKLRAAQLSAFSNAGLVLVQVAVGLAIGSVSMLSVAVDSAIDVVASLIALISIRVASRPADQEHRYGHGKIESVAALLEGLLVVGAAAWLVVEAVKSIRSGDSGGAMTAGLIVMALSAVVKALVSSHLQKVAKEEDSPALAAEATNLRADVLTSAAVFGGLALRAVTGLAWVDGALAICVSALILRSGFRLVYGAVMDLMDVGLPAEEEAEIVQLIEQHSGEFVEFHDLRTRQAGAERHVDFHLVVHGGQSLEKVHCLCDQIEEAILGRFPTAQVLIHPEPCAADCAYCQGSRSRQVFTMKVPRRYRSRGLTFRRSVTIH